MAKGKNNIASKKTMPESKKNSGIVAYSHVDTIGKNNPRERRKDALPVQPSPWVPAFDSDQFYFRYLSEILRQSPTQMSCVLSKTNFVVGDDFNLEYGKKSIKPKPIAENTISDKDAAILDGLIEMADAAGEGLREVLYKIALCIESNGNGYALLKKVKVGATTRVYISPLESIWCRVSRLTKDEPIPKIGVSANWEQEFGIKEVFNLQQYGCYPYWTADDNTGNIIGRTEEKAVQNAPIAYSVIHVKNYLPEYFYYGMPDSLASLIYQQLEKEIGNFNLDEFYNGFMANTLIQGVVDNSDDEKNVFNKSLKNTFTRSKDTTKSNRIFTNLVSSKEALLTVQKLDAQIREGAFRDLVEISREQIITAHRWHPQLAGIMMPGKLGNSTQDIVNVYSLAMATVIKPKQKTLIDKIITPYLRLNGVEDYTLSISNQMPLSFAGQIDVNEILLKNEMRKMIGEQELNEEQMAQLNEEIATRNKNVATKEPIKPNGNN
jgi:hypothetical protein